MRAHGKPRIQKTIFGNVSLRSKSSGRSVCFPNLGGAREGGEIGRALLLTNVHTAGHQFHLSHTADASKILIFCHRNTADVYRYNLVVPTGSALNPNKHIHITQIPCFENLECSERKQDSGRAPDNVELSHFPSFFSVCTQKSTNSIPKGSLR